MTTAFFINRGFKKAFVKKLLIFFTGYLLIPSASTLTQTIGGLPPWIEGLSGDTVGIKTLDEMAGEPNALYQVLLLDSINVPPDRVYLLRASGVYPLQNNPNTWYNRTTVIVGSDPTPLVSNKNVNSALPLICGNVSGSTSNAGGINANSDLTIKNCALVPAADDGTLGWSFTTAQVSNLHLLYDNCIFEHTRDVFVKLANANCNVIFRNCYFVNMSGQPCRRNGGVFDCFANQDTLLVENCTFINAQGNIFNFRTYPFKRIIFNHNTFINCAGSVFMNPGYQNNISLTNNIFVNCNVQSYADIYIYDNPTDSLPMGLVNVADSAKVPIKFLIERNLVYWDPLLADMDSILNANKVNGVTNWQSQMITMNSRTKKMFDNSAMYPFLQEGRWYTEKPNFTDPKDLFTTRLAHLKSFALATVDTSAVGYTAVLPDWRLVNTGADELVYPDWPIPVDLSYTDARLLTGGMGSFPIGDLNWFPTRKTGWLAQRTAEYAFIQYVLDNGYPCGICDPYSVDDHDGLPAEFQLQQNYPNPFNPSTMISFSIPKAGYVTLKVYNTLGEEVATLLDGFKTAQTYNLKFDGTDFASGFYFCRLTMNGYTAAKKMVLLR
jgi:hypothetical protein